MDIFLSLSEHTWRPGGFVSLSLFVIVCGFGGRLLPVGSHI